jgi:predicted acylesterase/phospholipase RssA
MSQPTLFRTWDAPRSHRNVTILEAARATCSMPGLFKNAEIADGETIETFVDAGYGWNNPVYYVLGEAKTLAPTPSYIASLGTGLESVIELPKPSAFQSLLPTRLIQVFKKIAHDCEKTAEEAAREFGTESDFYVRLNVERGMDSISLEEWEKSSEVVTHTKQYLRRHEISRKVDRLVNVLHPPTRASSGNGESRNLR